MYHGSSSAACSGTNSPTELELALVNPDLSPENKKFLGQKRFQNTTKMVPSEILTTARQVIYSHYICIANIVGRKRPLHASLLPSEPSHSKFHCKLKS